MAEYYIRTPNRDESRGPFTPAQLQTLVEAGQVTIDTLYYDDPKEEWLPIGMNPELKGEVFPEREKLKLKVDTPEEEPDKKAKKVEKKKKPVRAESRSTISDMLAAAENRTKNARSVQKRDESFERAIYLTDNGLCLIMLLSAVTLIAPYLIEIKSIFLSQRLGLFLNYPLILLGIFDLLMSIYVYFGDRKLHSILRGRAMLTLGFGAYIGWALGDVPILIASAAFGIGTLWSTLVQRFLLSIPAVVLGLGGSAFLAYLSLTGYLDELMHHVFFEFFTGAK